MASNRKKVMVPHTMGKEGVALLRQRDDIEVVIYPGRHRTGRAAADAVGRRRHRACPARRTGSAEMDASPAMEVVARIGVGYDAVEVPALTARRVPLMVAGTANSTSVAEHAFHLMMALAKRTPALDAHGAQGHLGRSPWRAADGAVRQDRADRRLRPHRHALGAALPGLRHERADLRSVRAGGEDHRQPDASASPTSMPRCRAPISCRSIARRIPRRSACSTRHGWRV